MASNVPYLLPLHLPQHRRYITVRKGCITQKTCWQYRARRDADLTSVTFGSDKNQRLANIFAHIHSSILNKHHVRPKCVCASRTRCRPNPANTILSPNAGVMLAHRLRRWVNINPALGERIVFAGKCNKLKCWISRVPRN